MEDKEQKIEEIWIRLQQLYFKQSDTGLCASEEQEVWKLEKEYEELNHTV